MRARRLVCSLAAVICTGTAGVTPLLAVDATVTDRGGQNISVREVVFGDNQPFLQLELVAGGSDSNKVKVSLHAAMLKELVDNAGTKRERSYQAELAATLTDGQQYRGQATGELKGESDVGKASVQLTKLTKASFTRAQGEGDFAPERGTVQTKIVDKNGNTFDVAATTCGRDRNSSDKLECSMGEIELAIPLENVAKIENIGEVKREYGEHTKLRITHASGKVIEASVARDHSLGGPFKYGKVSVPFQALSSAMLEKKK